MYDTFQNILKTFLRAYFFRYVGISLNGVISNPNRDSLGWGL